MVIGQLHEKHGSYATFGSKVMTRFVNKLKSRSKSDEVASVGLKTSKLACRASGISPFASSSKIDRTTTLDELARPSVDLQQIEATDRSAIKRLFECY